MEENLVRATALLAFVLWWVPVAGMLGHGVADRRSCLSLIGLSGAAVMLAHIVLSFHVVHDWSHSAAVEETARQTDAVVGVNWGGGVWLNYVFALIWLGDAGWRWFDPQGYVRRPRALSLAVHGFLAFIWFNATVVFGSPFFRVIGLIGFLLLGVVAGRGRSEK